MPLVQVTLADALEQIFAQPADTFAAVARQWADAVRDYAAAIVPAVPPPAASAAADALAGSLAVAFSTLGGGALAATELAFTTYGVALGTGMAPAFLAVPPAGPVGFVAQAAAAPQTAREAAVQLAGRIHAWLLTGTATPPVGNPTTPWS